MKLILSLILVLSTISCQKKKTTSSTSPASSSGQVIDVSNLEGELDPIATTEAEIGGTLTQWAESYPKSLNMWEEYTSFNSDLMGLLYEPLLTMHSVEDKAVGVLAQSWTISKDQKEFTYKLNPKAKWSDGKAITAADVQFYFDVIMNPKHQTPIFRIGLSRFNRPVVIDSLTLKIEAKEPHWMNFWETGRLTAFPKHLWEGKDFNKVKWDFPIVSGPYKIGEFKENRYFTLKRRADWWGRSLAYHHNKFNFEKIKYRFISDRVKALEAFKKGDLLTYGIYTSSIWMKQTDFPAVKKGWVARERIFNQEPKSFQGFAFNLRLKKFQDKKVRQAIAHLLNLRLINEKLMYNQYFILNSFFPDLYPNKINPKRGIVEYQPDLARQLLAEAGWKPNSNGFLEKEGEVFTINFMTASPDIRYLTIFVEDLKKVGFKASIEKLSYATIRKRVTKFEFDMRMSAWGAVRLRNPESLWHSREADNQNSNNVPGYKNPVVDSIINALKVESDIKLRNEGIAIMDSILIEDIPYILMWQSNHHRLLYWKMFNTPTYRFSKFGRGESIIKYWSFNYNKKKSLEKAQDQDQSLPQNRGDIYYK